MNRILGFGHVFEVFKVAMRLDAINVIDFVTGRTRSDESRHYEPMNKASMGAFTSRAERNRSISAAPISSQDASSRGPARVGFSSNSPEVRYSVIRELRNESPIFSWQGAEQRFRWVGCGPLAFSANQAGLAGRFVADDAGRENAAHVDGWFRVDIRDVTKLALWTISQLQASAGTFVLRMLPAFRTFGNRQRTPWASAFGAGLELHLGGLSHG